MQDESKHDSILNIGKLLLSIKLQLIVIGVLMVYLSLWLSGYHWSFHQILDGISIFFRKNGNWLVACVSFLENLYPLNAILPFSIVILTVMGSTHGMPNVAVVTFLFIYFSSVTA